MTFSIVARDATGALGAAISSSSPAVAARCVHLDDGVGGVLSQNVTDPRLGALLLERLSAGETASQALQTVTLGTADIAYRQLLLVDGLGRAAAFSGELALGTFGEAVADGVAAGGNLLASGDVPQIMVDRYMATEGDLEQRLFAALRAAVDAGGEAGPVHSAGLAVVRHAGWRVTDLRVDWTEADPIDELGRLLEIWMPQRDDYVVRGLNPSIAPSFGAPGDE